MVLKVIGIGFALIGSALAAPPEASVGTCDQIEKTYAEFEKPITCDMIASPRDIENPPYRSMCAGCDAGQAEIVRSRDMGEDYTQRRLHPNAANPGGSSPGFDVGNTGKGSPEPLDKLNRLPTMRALLKSVYPNLTGDCRETKYKAEHAAECEDNKQLADLFFPQEEFGDKKIQDQEIAALDNAIAKHKVAVDKAITKSGDKGDNSIYVNACLQANGEFKKVRDNYNRQLGVHKDGIWSRVIGEMAVKRHCLAHYISEHPDFWCGKTNAQGQKPDLVACAAGLETKPAVILEKFKKFATDPVVLEERNKLKLATSTLPPGISPIQNKVGDGWSSNKLKDQAIRDEQRNQDAQNNVKKVPAKTVDTQ